MPQIQPNTCYIAEEMLSAIYYPIPHLQYYLPVKELGHHKIAVEAAMVSKGDLNDIGAQQ